MKTKAVRIHGKMDLRLEEIELPQVWFADEEFPASGRLLLDESAPHYLTIEDAVTVGSLILDQLTGAQHWAV